MQCRLRQPRIMVKSHLHDKGKPVRKAGTQNYRSKGHKPYDSGITEAALIYRHPPRRPVTRFGSPPPDPAVQLVPLFFQSSRPKGVMSASCMFSAVTECWISRNDCPSDTSNSSNEIPNSQRAVSAQPR